MCKVKALCVILWHSYGLDKVGTSLSREVEA